MTNDDKDLKPMIEKTECQECKALVSMNEYHTFSHCLIAKAYPDFWRSIVKDLTSKTTPQQPSEPLKEFVSELRKWWSFDECQQHTHSWHEREDFIEKIVPKYFGQPSEKKALSVDSIKALLTTIMKKELVDIGEHFCFVCGEPMSEEKRGLLINHIAQSIFDALPAQREVRYPEKKKPNDDPLMDKYHYTSDSYNEAIDEFKKLNGG